MYRPALLLMLCISITSCLKENPEEIQEPITPGIDIPNELRSYFSDFKAEGERHGLTIDYELSNVTAEIRYINDGSVAGTCTTNGHNLRHIVIDQKFWNRASDLLREMVVFHELGHCILGRGHTEGSFENGICRSIMRSGVGNCRDAYTATNRRFYVSELFASN